jgi:enoyl-CoA hydratase/carnithine racemase
MLPGVQAQDIGLVDHCLPPEQLSPEALTALKPARIDLHGKWRALAEFMDKTPLNELLTGEFEEDWQQKTQKKLRQKAPIALKLAWTLIEENENRSAEEALQNELDHLTEVFSTEDALEGLKSIGKSRPSFKGK